MRDACDKLHLQSRKPSCPAVGHQDQPHGHGQNTENAKARKQVATAQCADCSFHRTALVLYRDLPGAASIGILQRLKSWCSLRGSAATPVIGLRLRATVASLRDGEEF